MREYGSEYPLAGPSNYLKNSDSEAKGHFFRSGRDAFGFVADFIYVPEAIILLPAYCCESMVLPFVKRNWYVEYYPLNEDFSVKTDSLIQLCSKHKPNAVLLMNFFGVAPVSSAASALKSYSQKLFIIEDFTHTLFSDYTFHDLNIDFRIASIRKWIGIPDGAVLLTRHYGLSTNLKADEKFVALRSQGMVEKFLYNFDKKTEIKDHYLKILRDAELLLNEYSGIYGMSELSLKVFNDFDVSGLGVSRRQNFVHLFNLLSGLPGLEIPIKLLGMEVPFSLPVIVKDRDLVQKKFAQNGLYAPVLWPMNEDSRRVCRFSTYISDSMLSLPIDQRYDFDDIEEIADIVKLVLSDF